MRFSPTRCSVRLFSRADRRVSRIGLETCTGMEKDMIGLTGSPFQMVVERGKVREFAKATKSSHPEYFGSHPISPVTFLMTAVFWQDENSSPFGSADVAADVLHGEQEFIFYGPPPSAGTVLTCQERVDNVYERLGSRGGRMKITEIVTEFRDISGNLRAETRKASIKTLHTRDRRG
jgi:N-terminal half of MaoC dehydratase